MRLNIDQTENSEEPTNSRPQRDPTAVPIKVHTKPDLKPNAPATKLGPVARSTNFSAMEGFSTRPTSPKAEYIKPKLQPAQPIAVGPKPKPTISQPDIDDQVSDDVIEDILISESNELLAAQDALIDSEVRNKDKPKRFARLKSIFTNKWLYFSLGLLVIIIFAVPYSRYHILGQFLKNQYQFSLEDSTTHTPISGALIKVAGKNLTTNSSGRANIDLPLGSYAYSIQKQYYRSSKGSLFVGLSKPSPSTIDLVATGRQVPIKVLNKISNKPLSGAEISVLGINVYTNSNGQADIVLPTKSSNYTATITDANYNSVTTNLVVSVNVSANTINLVPSGSVYFLTNDGGTMNVVKANLDGSDPQVILAGTGKESTTNTFLMASPDWKYLVLEAARSSAQPELYVINTANDHLTEFDSAADSFNLIGWSGDQFIYDEIDSSDPTSTVGREQLKSYNASTSQLNVLDQDQVDTTDASDYAYQNFYNFELLPNIVIYNTQWNVSGTYDLSSLSDSIRGVEPNGLNKKDYYTLAAASTGSIEVARYQPSSLYYSVFNNANNQTSYYAYSDGAVIASTTATATTFSQSYPDYYLSPSGAQTLWTQTTNGQATTYEGNQNGQSQLPVTLPAGYTAYGWFDNVYILLSKGGQLYIAPATGSTNPVLLGSYFTATG